MPTTREFTCYTNKDRDYDVIETKKYNKMDVFNGTFWPAMITGICALISVALFVRKCRGSTQRRDDGGIEIQLNTSTPHPAVNQHVETHAPGTLNVSHSTSYQIPIQTYLGTQPANPG